MGTLTVSMPHRVYVGTIGEGVWRSLDGGISFTRAADGMFVECHVRALVVHPQEPRVLYLGSEQGLFRSTNGADSWSRVDSPLDGRQIWSFLVHPRDPDLLVAGTCPAQLFRSADGGRTWLEPAVKMRQECPRILHTRVTTVVADPVDADTLWAGVEIDGVYRSRDRGETWLPVGRSLSSQDIHGLALVPAPEGRGPTRFVASTNNDLNASLDDGESWQPLDIGRVLPWSYCRGLAQLAYRPEVILLGNGDGPPGTKGIVARSADGGKTWAAARMPGPANSTIWNFAVHAADPSLVYASSVSGEVYRSVNAGETWDKLDREFGEIRALAWAPE
jgi:photosystem II stability/assembly factor-like uncharacterized protein